MLEPLTLPSREAKYLLSLWCRSLGAALFLSIATLRVYAQSIPQHRVAIAGDLSIGSVMVDSYERIAVASGSATILLNSERSAFTATGMFSRFSSGSLSGYGNVYGAYLLTQQGLLSITVNADGGIGAYRRNISGRYMKTGFRLGVSNYFWAEASTSWAYDTTAYSTLSGTVSTIVSRKKARAFTAAGITQARDRPLGHLSAGVEYRPGRIHFAGQFGVMTDPSRSGFGSGVTWGQVTAALQLRSSTTVNVTVGRLPVDPQRALPAARTFSVGIRFYQPLGKPKGFDGGQIGAPISSVRMIRLAGDSVRLIIQLDEAEKVEIRGSFTGWRAMTMQKAPNGAWITNAVLRPGLNSIAIRINDGFWRAPPGLPTANDDFGGEHGLLVVQ